jgi:hypothetical protein
MNTRWNKQWMILVLAVLSAAVVPSAARGGVVTNDPELPVTYPTGEFRGVEEEMYPQGVILQDVRLRALPGSVNRLASGLDELESFSCDIIATASVSGGPSSLPFLASGPATIKAFGKIGQTTGTFSTEMLGMNLTGSLLGSSVMIRESPTLHSTGSTTVGDLGGGQYQIDSFFDVFVELSIDGGATWAPDMAGPTHVTLQSTQSPSTGPEPAALGLLGIAFLATRKRLS